MAKSVRQFKETIEFRSLPLNRIRSHRYFPVAVIALVILAAACIHVWQRVLVIELAKEVGQLEHINRDLVDGARKLQTDIAGLTMATRIEQYAIDSLGMRRVHADSVVTLVREEARDMSADDLATVISSIKRVADYLPVVTEAQAAAQDLQPITFEAFTDDEDSR